jgi:hypothetical protein
MARRFPREWWSDARHYQIAALSTLLVFNLGWLDFGARPLNSALAITRALLTQAACTRPLQTAELCFADFIMVCGPLLFVPPALR